MLCLVGAISSWDKIVLIEMHNSNPLVTCIVFLNHTLPRHILSTVDELIPTSGLRLRGSCRNPRFRPIMVILGPTC